MKGRFIKVILAILCLSTVLFGCGKKVEEPKNEYADEAFIKDMAKGLESRWGLIDKDENKEGYDEILVNSEENKKMMLSYVEAEITAIEKYKDKKFKDSHLQEIAIKYNNLLTQHKELCEYITVDYDKYTTEYTPIYSERSKIIEEMLNKYEMKIDKKYEDDVNDFKVTSQLIKEEEQVEKEIQNMLSSIQFEEVLNEYGYKTYQGIIENTTSKDYSSFSVSINLLNAEGVIVETTWDQISAFKQGTKAQLEFSTDKKFASTEVIADWWE